jgi:hypothetical protein
MNTDQRAGSPAETAAEVCKTFPLGNEARPLLRASQTPRPFLDQLLAKKQHLDAIRFLAHALSKREAVWWATECVRSVVDQRPPAEAAAAL